MTDGQVKAWMENLKSTGKYEVSAGVKQKILETFWGGFCDDDDTLDEINRVFRETSYVMDTHTAVAQTGVEPICGRNR